MAEEKEAPKKLSRKDFVKGAAAVAGAGALASCAPAATPVPTTAPGETAAPAPTCPPAAECAPCPSAVPETWDKEADVVVVGYGGAGAATAITASDQGAQVLLLEKQAEDSHTSNTQMCFGVFVSPTNVEDALAYMEVASRVNVDMPESKDIDDDVIQVWAEYMVQNKDWLTSLGAEDFVVYADQGRDPSWPGNDAIKAYNIAKPDGGFGVGVDFFNFLAEQVSSRNIEIMWETPATSLITNGEGAVIGVKAQSEGGAEMTIKAKRAVVLTCGGYEFDEAALKTYLPAYPMVFYGNPDNTGDGVKMAQSVGADLWHMTVLGGGLKMKFPDFPTAFLQTFGAQAYLVVDKLGKRFMNEAIGGYSDYWNTVVYDTVNYTWPRIPAYWIFDQKRMDAGPLAFTLFGAAGPIGMYEWSLDNSAELDKGWIISAESVAELAESIDVDPAALEEELSKYNEYCQSGQDADFGRPADSLIALESPYYAVKLWPGLNNTFGGPRRNAKGLIVNALGEAIPRLYSAGELGSIYVQYPQGGANVGECLAFGRVAGENAAAEEPWG